MFRKQQMVEFVLFWLGAVSKLKHSIPHRWPYTGCKQSIINNCVFYIWPGNRWHLTFVVSFKIKFISLRCSKFRSASLILSPPNSCMQSLIKRVSLMFGPNVSPLYSPLLCWQGILNMFLSYMVSEIIGHHDTSKPHPSYFAPPKVVREILDPSQNCS